jgi:uncharacterized membrane protein
MSSESFTPFIKVEHIISFNDAIFAFAITLMALSIDIPDLPPYYDKFVTYNDMVACYKK